MDFKEALVIVNEVLPETLGRRYDGILVKRLEASNTLDEGRTTNQTHIAITGEQMNILWRMDILTVNMMNVMSN